MKWDAEKYDAVKAPQVDAGRELIAMAGVRENDSVLGDRIQFQETIRLCGKGDLRRGRRARIHKVRQCMKI